MGGYYKIHRMRRGVLFDLGLAAIFAVSCGRGIAQDGLAENPSPSVQTLASQSSPTIAPADVTTIPTLIPTPNFLDTAVADGFLLSSQSNPDCQLPCWQGLRVGQSSQQDIQAMFDTVFGFNGTLDFTAFPQGIEASHAPLALDIAGTRATGYVWLFRPSRQWVSYEIDMIVDEQTETLKGIRFIYNPGETVGADNTIVSPGYYALHTPQGIIRALGAPDFILVQPGIYDLNITLIYREGIVSIHNILGAVEERVVSGTPSRYTTFCLDSQSLYTIEFIIEPFESLDNADLNLVQQGLIHDWIAGPNLASIEDGLGISIAAITSLAIEEEHPCFTVDVSDY